jgi:branched-chain amino acid transport system permease protein
MPTPTPTPSPISMLTHLPRRAPRKRTEQNLPRKAVTTGLIFGATAVYIASVGILLMMNGRWIILDWLTLGQAVLFALALGAGIATRRRQGNDPLLASLAAGVLAGAIAGAVLAVFAVVISAVDLRSIFVALSPELLQMLTFGLGLRYGVMLLVASGGVVAGIGVLSLRTPRPIRRILLAGCIAVMALGVFQELIQLMMQRDGLISDIRDSLYSWNGLTAQGAGIAFVAVALAAAVWTGLRSMNLPALEPTPERRRWSRAAGVTVAVLLLLVVPLLAGQYIGQVLLFVGLYILMGMGLNLEVGLAGLLDLGFVAFFAVGAYTTALLTADNPYALAAYTAIPSLSFWAAMPLAVIMSVTVGIVFGIPVLGVRGDYLAVATLGLGEIVRVFVQSDFAQPLLAGASGFQQIPRPKLGGFELDNPVYLFYLTLAAAAVAAYFAWRLENSRLGRAWMALRDDEDVAQALGINLVKVKLLAYGLGAAFAGLAGSIFATMLTSVYPSSFQLLISINVLAVIIVGGMGSLPGVVVGALALVGIPELLREFGEYRYLFYGAALIAMMRIRPEGLWPSKTRRRELRGVSESAATDSDAEPSLGAVPMAKTSSPAS